jgi:hypothetical protein
MDRDEAAVRAHEETLRVVTPAVVRSWQARRSMMRAYGDVVRTVHLFQSPVVVG